MKWWCQAEATDYIVWRGSGRRKRTLSPASAGHLRKGCAWCEL